ncbi:Hypothetical protein HVR_LOCUS310 [uncultured virus]|nr:Hypothetical protein HVR_LOCUS310 [uncultured virus]
MTSEDPIYFPDDNKTRIYYEKIEDDLLTALMNKNKERTDWIISNKSKFKIGESTINMCFVECILRDNVEMAEYLDEQFNISEQIKAEAEELRSLSPWDEPLLVTPVGLDF